MASPLAGLVHCSKCGRLMNMMGRHKGAPYLLCPTKGCSAGTKFEFVEQAVLNQLEDMAKSLEIAVMESRRPDVSFQQEALAKMRAQQVKLEDRRNRLYSLLEDGTYSRELFSERMQVLAQEEAALKESIDAMEGEIRQELSRNQEEQLARIRTVLDQYGASSLSDRKEMLHSIIADILYTKEKKSKPADFSLSIKLKSFI